MTDLAALRDRAAIEDLIATLGIYLGQERADDLGDVFAEDVVAQFPGGEPFQGLDRLKRDASHDLPQYAGSQHVIANAIVELDGDEASARANLIATHATDVRDRTQHWELGGRYDLGLRRTPYGWRIARLTLTAVWLGGERPGA